jgi:hypothetical protein
MWGIGQPKIEFICEDRDKGVIAEPMPARAALPDWFRRLSPIDHGSVSATNNGLTIKRCMPFADALKLGWTVPVCATVRLEISKGGAQLDAGWDFDRPMVTFHNREQVAGHPRMPRPPAKLHNYWTIRTPKGWSCLFTPLLNRSDSVIEIVSGVVDTDTYPAPIHFPFFATGADGRYTLEKGLPLVQVIPFRRDVLHSRIRSETEHEADVRQRALRAMQAGDGWYRTEVRANR